jgi:hypothetical protein
MALGLLVGPLHIWSNNLKSIFKVQQVVNSRGPTSSTLGGGEVPKFVTQPQIIDFRNFLLFRGQPYPRARTHDLTTDLPVRGSSRFAPVPLVVGTSKYFKFQDDDTTLVG